MSYGNVGDTYTKFKEDLLNKGFIKIGRGSFRTGYARKNIIIKVPHNVDGVIDNMVEACAWHKYKSQPTNRGLYLAPCRLLPNAALSMVKLDVTTSRGWPAWTKNILDGKQCGWKKNKLYVYDYAIEIVERYEWEKQWNVQSYFFNKCMDVIGPKEPAPTV